jgi:hypothetical protein
MARYMNGHTGVAQALTDHHGLRIGCITNI